MKKKKSKPPSRKETAESAFKLTEPPDPNHATPRFCLRHLRPKFDILALDIKQRAAFAEALQKRGKMSWIELILAPRHGLGTENLPSSQIKPGIPEGLEELEEFMVMRYSGKLPMVGFRTSDTFHVVWIEANFGDVYDHG